MVANVDLRSDAHDNMNSKLALKEIIQKHDLQIAAQEDLNEFTWKRNKQKDASPEGYLDFVLTKNIKTESFKIGDF